LPFSDSTHGEIRAFETYHLRVRDSDDAEGVGYTYTVGRNGGAIADILCREIAELIEGLRGRPGITSGDCTMAGAADLMLRLGAGVASVADDARTCCRLKPVVE
jgi:hypothetical protein